MPIADVAMKGQRPAVLGFGLFDASGVEQQRRQVSPRDSLESPVAGFTVDDQRFRVAGFSLLGPAGLLEQVSQYLDRELNK